MSLWKLKILAKNGGGAIIVAFTVIYKKYYINIYGLNYPSELFNKYKIIIGLSSNINDNIRDNYISIFNNIIIIYIY